MWRERESGKEELKFASKGGGAPSIAMDGLERIVKLPVMTSDMSMKKVQLHFPTNPSYYYHRLFTYLLINITLTVFIQLSMSQGLQPNQFQST